MLRYLYTEYDGVGVVHVILSHLLDSVASVRRHVHCLSLKQLNKVNYTFPI